MDRYDEIREYVNNILIDIENMKFYKRKIICLYMI